MTEVQKLGLKDFIVLKIFDAVWMLLEYPLKFFVTKSEASGPVTEWFLATILCKILTLGSAIL